MVGRTSRKRLHIGSRTWDDRYREKENLWVGAVVGRKKNVPRRMNGMSQSWGPVRRGAVTLGVVGTKHK